MRNLLPSSQPLLRRLLPLALILPAGGALAAAAAEQIAMTAAQISQAGISTVAVVTSAGAGSGEGNAVVLSGTVVAPASALTMAAASTAGVVQQIHANSLQVVAAGAPLVTLFSPQWMEVQRDYVQLAAQARLAAAKLVRDESLYADGIIAHVRLDESRTAAQLARLAAEQRAQSLRAGGMGAAAIKALPANGQLSPLLTVRSASAGTVLELPVSLGQQLEAGMAVAKISRDGPLWVELQASRQQLPLLAVGDLLRVADCGKLRVIAISPLVNGVNQTAQVRAQQVERNACLKVNAFVEARLEQPRVSPGALLVPSAAVVRHGEQNYVFVRTKAGFQAVPVSAAAAGADQSAVRGALAAGAQVAVRGLVALKGVWAGLGAAESKGEH
ncbi:MAG: efflux RND transporter periplasmic adaptor subunit [Sphingomonadaceae bacterium]